MNDVINNIEVRDKILTASKELFMKNGYNGTSVRDIATASGTNVAMVNYYFGSKEKLFGEVFEDIFNFLAGKIISTLISDLPFFEMIELWLDTYYEVLSKYPQMPNFLLNEVNMNPEQIIKLVNEKNPNEVYESITKRIENEIEKGTIKKMSPDHLLLSILSLGVFPFVFDNMATAVLDISLDNYIDMMQKHKKFVLEFIKNALKIES
ncbi:TetR/AcrR family transcriptional regulator [Bacteroidales bacterium OttesenSCG-928-I21]|nr:TetR/AcrR family transcriptional regulator [Bacteroidales bacterium OttesenSCG-928-I21]